MIKIRVSLLTTVTKGFLLVLVAGSSLLLSSCVVNEEPDGPVATGGAAVADGLEDAGVAAADIGLAAAAPVGVWGGGWWGGGAYQQNNYYNYNDGRRDGYRHGGYYHRRGYGNYRGGGFRGGGFRGGGRR